MAHHVYDSTEVTKSYLLNIKTYFLWKMIRFVMPLYAVLIEVHVYWYDQHMYLYRRCFVIGIKLQNSISLGKHKTHLPLELAGKFI